MASIEDLTINESEYQLADGSGNGKIAVLLYLGSGDPKKILDYAVQEYVEGSNGYHELVDAKLNNPWMRVILSDINNMPQKAFEPKTDKMMKHAS